MAYKEQGEWIFDKKEVDSIFEAAMNRPLKKRTALSENEILDIGKELNIDTHALQNAIIDIKSSSDILDLVQTSPNRRRRVEGAGGTKGGLKSFFIGAIMAISGGYLVMNQVQVRSTGFWAHRYSFFGGMNVSPFGATLIPFLLGVGMLFFNGKSKIGWILTGGSALAIFIGIITNLQLIFRPTSLYVTIIMFVLLIGGLGLIARSLKSFQ